MNFVTILCWKPILRNGVNTPEELLTLYALSKPDAHRHYRTAPIRLRIKTKARELIIYYVSGVLLGLFPHIPVPLSHALAFPSLLPLGFVHTLNTRTPSYYGLGLEHH